MSLDRFCTPISGLAFPFYSRIKQRPRSESHRSSLQKLIFLTKCRVVGISLKVYQSIYPSIMSSASNFSRKRCISANCRGFAVNRLPIVGEPLQHCKKCLSNGCTSTKPKKTIQWATASDIEGECNLCCESYADKKKFVLSCCKQDCCTSCIVHTASFNCPFCRQTFATTKDIHSDIIKAQKKAAHERLETIIREDRSYAASLQREQESNNNNSSGMRGWLHSFFSYDQPDMEPEIIISVHSHDSSNNIFHMLRNLVLNGRANHSSHSVRY
jgi:hypothetical protein